MCGCILFDQWGMCRESIAQACFHLKPSRWFDPICQSSGWWWPIQGESPLAPSASTLALRQVSSLGAPRRFLLSVVFVHFRLLLSRLSDFGDLSVSVVVGRGVLFSNVSNSILVWGSGAAFHAVAGCLAACGARGWDHPRKGAGRCAGVGCPGRASALARFAGRAGGVASEQQAPRAARSAVRG